MVLTDAQKQTIGALESGSLINGLGTTAFKQERYTMGGQTVTIWRDRGDNDGKKKAKCVKKAVDTIVGKGFDLPPSLAVYCTAAFAAQNRSFNVDSQFNQISVITLGSTALQNGRPDATSADHARYPGFSKGDITTIHEIGHCLHARNRGEAFFDSTSNLGRDAAGQSLSPVHHGQVSGYAATNRKEFVAEVFAGLMIGRVFSNEVITEYVEYGGPM